MTPEEMLAKLWQLRGQYITDSDTEDQGVRNEVDNAHWANDTDAWANYLGHPVTKPRPRPHS